MRILPLFVALFLAAFSSIAAQQSAPALRIVVIEGEGGVNIIQQKTAVRPLIEVRDRNNLPVSGASVTFTIGGGNSAAFAGGAQTLTVTTNAAGQAAASGLNAVSSGAFQIQVQAAYQGQVATAAISQTNFATAAAASQAGASAGAAGGGGMSATTIGIVGAAVAGGAVAATQLRPKQEESDADFDIYNGSVSGQLPLNSMFTPSTGPVNMCSFVRRITGTMAISLRRDGTGGAAAELSMSDTLLAGQCTEGPQNRAMIWFRENTPVTGAPSAVSFTHVNTTAILVENFRFNGTLSGNVITGTLTAEVVPTAGANPRFSGSTAISVTLSR